MNNYKDSKTLAEQCQEQIDQIKENQRKEAEALAKKKQKMKAIGTGIAVVCAAAVFVVTQVIIPNNKYSAAVALRDAGRYEEAIAAFEAINGYLDSVQQVEICKDTIKEIEYNKAVDLMNSSQYEEAIQIFRSIETYKDCRDRIYACEKGVNDNDYQAAVELMNTGHYLEAVDALKALSEYRDSSDLIRRCLIEYSNHLQTQTLQMQILVAAVFSVRYSLLQERMAFLPVVHQ